MDKQYCIFDMDGTLVDSMHFWKSLGRDYLHTKGISPDQRLLWMVQTMTMLESAIQFKETFGLSGSPEAMVAEMEAMMAQRYRDDVPLKPGVVAYLDNLRTRGARLCVATATAEPLAHACFARLGVDHYFDFILSCETIGMSKVQPDIYLLAAERLGAVPGEIAVFEDAPYAAETAKKAGFYTVGIQEPAYAEDWSAMQALCDEVILDWRTS